MEAMKENNKTQIMSFTSSSSSSYFMDHNQAIGNDQVNFNQNLFRVLNCSRGSLARSSSSDPLGFDSETARVRTRRSLDVTNLDPKRLKRIISNRLSAQRSRVKKQEYLTEMEIKVKNLEAEIAKLTPQVAVFRSRQILLQMEQNSLKEKMAAYVKNQKRKEAEIEEKRAQVFKLRQLQLKQEQHKFQEQMRNMQGSVWREGIINNQMVNNNQEDQSGETNGEGKNQLLGLINDQWPTPNNYLNGDLDCGKAQMNLGSIQPIELLISIPDSSCRGLGGIEQLISTPNTNASNNFACS